MRYISIFAAGLALAAVGCGSDSVGPEPDESPVPPVAGRSAHRAHPPLTER